MKLTQKLREVAAEALEACGQKTNAMAVRAGNEKGWLTAVVVNAICDYIDEHYEEVGVLVARAPHGHREWWAPHNTEGFDDYTETILVPRPRAKKPGVEEAARMVAEAVKGGVFSQEAKDAVAALNAALEAKDE